MRVLFVEDNEVNRRVVKEMLRAGGVDMAEAEDYDLIVMDLRMPVMDGMTAIRHLRARGDCRGGLPVIVITADDGPSIDADCRTAGADEVMHKPVSMSALFGAIGAVLAQRGDSAVMIA